MQGYGDFYMTSNSAEILKNCMEVTVSPAIVSQRDLDYKSSRNDKGKDSRVQGQDASPLRCLPTTLLFCVSWSHETASTPPPPPRHPRNNQKQRCHHPSLISINSTRQRGRRHLRSSPLTDSVVVSGALACRKLLWQDLPTALTMRLHTVTVVPCAYKDGIWLSTAIMWVHEQTWRMEGGASRSHVVDVPFLMWRRENKQVKGDI